MYDYMSLHIVLHLMHPNFPTPLFIHKRKKEEKGKNKKIKRHFFMDGAHTPQS